MSLSSFAYSFTPVIATGLHICATACNFRASFIFYLTDTDACDLQPYMVMKAKKDRGETTLSPDEVCLTPGQVIEHIEELYGLTISPRMLSHVVKNTIGEATEPPAGPGRPRGFSIKDIDLMLAGIRLAADGLPPAYVRICVEALRKDWNKLLPGPFTECFGPDGTLLCAVREADLRVLIAGKDLPGQAGSTSYQAFVSDALGPRACWILGLTTTVYAATRNTIVSVSALLGSLKGGPEVARKAVAYAEKPLKTIGIEILHLMQGPGESNLIMVPMTEWLKKKHGK